MNKVADELAGRALQHNHVGMWIHEGVHDFCKVGVVQMSHAGRIRAVQHKLTLFGLHFQRQVAFRWHLDLGRVSVEIDEGDVRALGMAVEFLFFLRS